MCCFVIVDIDVNSVVAICVVDAVGVGSSEVDRGVEGEWGSAGDDSQARVFVKAEFEDERNHGWKVAEEVFCAGFEWFVVLLFGEG